MKSKPATMDENQSAAKAVATIAAKHSKPLPADLDGLPFPSEGLHDDRRDDEKDVIDAGVVRADLGALGGVEDSLEERTEDGRFDAGPVTAGRFREGGQVAVEKWERGGGVKPPTQRQMN